MEPSDTEFEKLLRSHLASELDPHRGQAVRGFAREVTRPMERRLSRDAFRRRIAHYRPAVQRWANVGMAMAACTALGFYLPRIVSRQAPQPEVAEVVATTPSAGGNGVKVVTPSFANFEHTSVTRHVDEGAGTTADGGFGRRIRQQKYDTYRFTVPNTHEQYEMTLPSEEEILLPMGQQ